MQRGLGDPCVAVRLWSPPCPCPPSCPGGRVPRGDLQVGGSTQVELSTAAQELECHGLGRGCTPQRPPHAPPRPPAGPASRSVPVASPARRGGAAGRGAPAAAALTVQQGMSAPPTSGVPLAGGPRCASLSNSRRRAVRAQPVAGTPPVAHLLRWTSGSSPCAVPASVPEALRSLRDPHPGRPSRSAREELAAGPSGKPPAAARLCLPGTRQTRLSCSPAAVRS